MDQNKARILSLFAGIDLEEVKQIYDNCDSYLDFLSRGGLIAFEK